MRLPITPDTIDMEVETSIDILTKVRTRLQAIPGIDAPSSDEQTIEFLRELCGELMVVANKCSGVASVMAELTV